MKALLKLYESSFKAVLRLFLGSIKAVLAKQAYRAKTVERQDAGLAGRPSSPEFQVRVRRTSLSACVSDGLEQALLRVY